MTGIVAIIAIIVIVGVGYLLFQNFAGTDGGTGTDINVELPTGGGE